MPFSLQEIVTQLSTEHGLDFENQGGSLLIHSEHPGVLTISVLGKEELWVAIFIQGEHGSLIPTPGVLLQLGATEWHVLEVHQIRTPLAEVTNEQVVTLNQMPLPDSDALSAFIELFAQVILSEWVSVSHSVTLEERASTPMNPDTDQRSDVPF